MKVSELINQLKTMPQDAIVAIDRDNAVRRYANPQDPAVVSIDRSYETEGGYIGEVVRL